MKNVLISVLLSLLFCLNADAQEFLVKYDSITPANVRAFMKDWRHWSKQFARTASMTEYNELVKTNYRETKWLRHRYPLKSLYRRHHPRYKLAQAGDTIIHFDDNIDTLRWNQNTHGDYLLVGEKRIMAYGMRDYYRSDLKTETRAYTMRLITKAEADTLRQMKRNSKKRRLPLYVCVSPFIPVYNYDTVYCENKESHFMVPDGYISRDSIAVIYNSSEPVLYINNAIATKLHRALQSSPRTETQFGTLHYGVWQKFKKYFAFYYFDSNFFSLICSQRTKRIEHYTDCDLICYDKSGSGGHVLLYKRIDGKLDTVGKEISWWMY